MPVMPLAHNDHGMRPSHGSGGAGEMGIVVSVSTDSHFMLPAVNQTVPAPSEYGIAAFRVYCELGFS